VLSPRQRFVGAQHCCAPHGKSIRTMRILVTFAVEAEFAPWRRRHGFTRVEIRTSQSNTNQPSYEMYEANVAETDVDVLLTGIGWEDLFYNVAQKALRDLLKRKPDCCVSTGLAGGLNRAYRSGDIVAASQVILREGGGRTSSNKKLLKVAESCGAKVADTLITERHIVSEASSKFAMSKFGDFVDMESYHILQVVSGTQIPGIAVRGISDAADRDLPLDFNKVFDRDGTVRKRRLIEEIVRNPLRIPSIIRFGLQSSQASHAVADFLDKFISSFADYDGRVAASAYGEVAAR
jgi:adenosylhomocysteine nucleosidase